MAFRLAGSELFSTRLRMVRVGLGVIVLLLAASVAVTPASAQRVPRWQTLELPQGILNGEQVQTLLVGRRGADLSFSFEYDLDADGTFQANATVGGLSGYRGTWSIAADGLVTLTANPGSPGMNFNNGVTRVRVRHDGELYYAVNAQGSTVTPSPVF